MHFLHREPTGHEYGWQLPRQHQPRRQRRVPTRTKFFGASECSPLSPDPLEEANPAEGPGPRERSLLDHLTHESNARPQRRVPGAKARSFGFWCSTLDHALAVIRDPHVDDLNRSAADS